MSEKKGKYTKIDTTWLEDNHLQILFLLLQVHLMYMYEKAITEITKNGRKEKRFPERFLSPFSMDGEKAQLFQGVKKFSVGKSDLQSCNVSTNWGNLYYSNSDSFYSSVFIGH